MFDRCSSLEKRRIINAFGTNMPPLERLWEDRNRTPVLLVSGAIIVVVALVDWRTKTYVGFGFLYLFPIIFVAAFLPRWVVVLLAAGCAVLAEIPESSCWNTSISGRRSRAEAPPHHDDHAGGHPRLASGGHVARHRFGFAAPVRDRDRGRTSLRPAH